LPLSIFFFGCFTPITTTSSSICSLLVFTYIARTLYSVLSIGMSIFSKIVVVTFKDSACTSIVASTTFSS
jgi:hypothetical protein